MDLAGGLPQENGSRMRALLSGDDQTPLKDVVLLNAAAALALDSGEIATGVAAAREALESGAALAKLEQLIALSQRLG